VLPETDEEVKVMNENKHERLGAASGLAMVVLAIAAMAFERAPVTAGDFAANRAALVTQSMLFLAGSGPALWFIGGLRAHLQRAEGPTARLSSVVFGSGIAWITLNMFAQAFQIGVARDATGAAPDALLRTMTAVFTIANLPLAVMLLAVAVVSLRRQAFPAWSGWLAVAAAAAQAVLWLATVVDSGPLASDGWLAFALYPFFLIWLVPATVIMMRRPASAPQSGNDESRRLAHAGRR
jgi:hypothetical protein